jgi:hypothetical protein
LFLWFLAIGSATKIVNYQSFNRVANYSKDTPTNLYTQAPMYKVNDSTIGITGGSYLVPSDSVNKSIRPIAGTNVTITGTFPNLTFNASGGGGTSTVQQDSSYLLASTYLTNIANPTAVRKGLLLKNTNTAANGSSPAIAWQGTSAASTPAYWRSYMVGVNRNLAFEYSNDSTTWVTNMTINNTGLISSANTAGVSGFQVGNGIYNGSSLYIDGRGFGCIGATYPATCAAWEIKSTNSGLLQPRLTSAQRNAISTPVSGVSIHNTDMSSPNFYNGTNWTDFIISSAATLTIKYGVDYVFTGTTATYTLPAISATILGRQNGIKIKNRGSGTITLNTATGSTLYTTAAVATINIIAGAACELMPDGTYNLVMFNN